MSRATLDRPPLSVRLRLYYGRAVPEPWRDWAVGEVRSKRWLRRNLLYTFGPFGVLFLALIVILDLRDGTFETDRVGTLVLIYGSMLLGWMNGYRLATNRTERIHAIEAGQRYSYKDVPLRRWDLPLALGLGALVVVLLILFGP